VGLTLFDDGGIDLHDIAGSDVFRAILLEFGESCPNTLFGQGRWFPFQYVFIYLYVCVKQQHQRGVWCVMHYHGGDST
jgi:hypothetical protein